ncbi:phosphoketolase [Gordonia amarae]|uniref:Xylulose-5-phosphate/fructose-6-phosphate phosphoketolase n=2 Tax=Gordonia amarae TaxID=36821 RepID=G7GUI8_9ACTN|nr:phosphoketolase [Gordonia amarae]QHN20707.1 phosphoketolase [Gordonia amarae]QHN29559.1 phosphoketolase [Gordonia amarae]QHN38335.1 phosphoketolase [Gordonia amarae]GAB07263.1 xylulose-5-phosphate/fructose-6-phosphate phosphoketolase [Gordonia amarae NBRC 15530]
MMRHDNFRCEADRPRYSADELAADLRWWAAANYLTAAQIYLQDNAHLERPLAADDIKPRLLGHWGTGPGLSAIYAVLNRVIRETESSWMFVTGPGHGGPSIVANVFLEGTYSEIYPQVGQDAAGITALCRRFSTPGGIPSHVSVETPGSIHEGGELGYSLIHAAGAAFDNPDLIVACVIGDGEAETGPLAASWRLPAFLNAGRDGAVLPILHLNDAKISAPTVMGRSSDTAIADFLGAQGWDPVFVEGDDPPTVFTALKSAIDVSYTKIRKNQNTDQPVRDWPAIVLRTPKGWTGPAYVDGVPVEGTHRAHQVPLPEVRENPDHRRQLEEWLRGYQASRIFDDGGAVHPDITALAPRPELRMGAGEHANGGKLLRPLPLPPLADYTVDVPDPGRRCLSSTQALGEYLRDLYALDRTPDSGGRFRLFCPDETASNKLDAVFETTGRCWQLPIHDADDNLSPSGRVMEVLSEHLCQGWLEGYLLSGRHGIFASYEAFAMISVSMLVQHVKWLQHAQNLAWRAPVASMNVLLTSTCWRNDHNGFSHQGPGVLDAVLPLAPGVVRVWLPPDANSLLTVADQCLRSRDHVNVVIADKQPHLQYMSEDQAREQVAAGASTWPWAGNQTPDREPDVVLAAAGDIPAQEVVAAAEILRDRLPQLRFRVVNVLDLMALLPPDTHPHGLSDGRFAELFTADRDVVFAFHGYPRAVHQLVHGRPRPDRFHVRGYTEQGTTTTPFDMVVLNGMSRYHLVTEVLRYAPAPLDGVDAVADYCRNQLERHREHIRTYFDDLPEIRDWTFVDAAR